MFLQFVERVQASALVLADPALVDLVKRRGIQVVKFLATAPDRRDQVGRFEQRQMLGHRLPGHVEILAKLAQSLTVVGMQPIE